MQNTTHVISSPKYQLIENLLRECFLKNISHSRVIDSNGTQSETWCPRTFDGFSCWDTAPAGSTAVQACPEFIVGFDPRRLAFKRCTENGTWFAHPEARRPWTNYTTCVDVEDLDFRNVVNVIYVGGYSISVAALLISLLIFLYFRALQCTRIRIHMHLFMAFTITNILWIVWYRVVVNNVEVVQENKDWCQVLHVVTQYFMVSSYVWMFCEGLHLHIALVVVFVKDEVAMRWFIALGWGVSLIIVVTYATVRHNIPGATERCWMDESDIFWIINVPVGISLIASFVFLVNVVRVLLTKLHPAPNQHASLAARKATRAALILVRSLNS
ncbi:calcitonin gene-related peptide type 1 receptor-like [Hyposmocoma kahamanoa]|uniref:calcitonin gene-related peptide type 1 receptor-like n=1 Tax=Hyposmocoma kahamanoa TaxID=1477025 RepID=UPI000E6D93AB|nr:calcitonin gene-related peptide type 1 receptor-like [Hyposmocoma kahamanoa]